jgi:hypothetical protein
MGFNTLGVVVGSVEIIGRGILLKNFRLTGRAIIKRNAAPNARKITNAAWKERPT